MKTLDVLKWFIFKILKMSKFTEYKWEISYILVFTLKEIQIESV